MKAGDFLIIRNMPYPNVVKYIEEQQKGYQGHHCAIVLSREKEGTCIYDAQPPKVRWSTAENYVAQILKWSQQKRNWREREERPLVLEIWSFPLVYYEKMKEFAESKLGYHYSMILGYFWPWDIQRWFHCSEFIGAILTQIGVKWEKDLNKLTPFDIHEFFKESFWDCETLTYEI